MSSGMQVEGSTPGLCGSIAAGTKWFGKSRLTRKQSSLQIAAHALDTWKSPTWCAMKLARGRRGLSGAKRLDLAVAPRLEHARRGRVVAVNVDDHRVFAVSHARLP